MFIKNNLILKSVLFLFHIFYFWKVLAYSGNRRWHLLSDGEELFFRIGLYNKYSRISYDQYLGKVLYGKSD